MTLAIRSAATPAVDRPLDRRRSASTDTSPRKCRSRYTIGGGLARVAPFLLLDREDRTHLDLSAADAREQQAEVERLISLGAHRVEDWVYPDDADFVVLADTEGNLFCVIDAGR
jgi:Glyoxalase-like domain